MDDRVRQSLSILAGVGVLSLGFAGIANHLSREARLAEAARAQGAAPGAASEKPAWSIVRPPAEPGPAAAARDVTPADMAALRGPAEREALVRLPPRLPEPEPEVSGEATREVRLRLLQRPVAVDAATLRIGQGTLRLPGVSALSPDESCTASADGAVWPCGRSAVTALRGYLRGRAIRCEAPDGFGRGEEALTSACTVGGGEDVGAWVVRNGWAAAAPGGPYVEAEAQARAERAGLWR